MPRVIDIHAHLGDIFHYNRNVTFKQNVQKGGYADPFATLAESGFSKPLIGDSFEEFRVLCSAGHELCWENTVENLGKRLDTAGVTYICLYPVLPNTSFEEYLAASKLEGRILPFTSADYSLPIDEMVKKLERDIERGARGLKIHPVLQNISLRDDRVKAAVRVFGDRSLPVVSHCGANDYYTEGEDFARTPEYGDVKYFIELVKEFPEYPLIAGHCGGLMGGEMEILSAALEGYDHVYVDTTFRSAADIKRMVDFFGRDKVLFGTDTPFSNHKYAIEAVQDACGADADLADMILYKNAAQILCI